VTEITEVKTMLTFLEEIGIPVAFKEIEDECFLPGLLIENGTIIIDQNKLKYPGDILHEAAHIAVVPAEDRLTLNGKEIGNRKDNAAEELMAIAWSYAAAVHLGIDLYTVFHNGGYDGGGQDIADNFKSGKYFGTPMLQWTGMTAEKKMAKELGINPYPAMLKWLRE
jgi:hypothetical protein